MARQAGKKPKSKIRRVKGLVCSISGVVVESNLLFLAGDNRHQAREQAITHIDTADDRPLNWRYFHLAVTSYRFSVQTPFTRLTAAFKDNINKVRICLLSNS